jgi:hypothetical protein
MEAIVYSLSVDVNNIQERLENFGNILSEINSQMQRSPSPVISSSLASTQRTLERLHKLLQIRIIRSSKRTLEVRRQAWLRNKSKIVALQTELELHRDTLVAALGACNL